MGGTGAAAQRTRDRAGGTPAPLSRLWPWLALTCVLGPCAGASADSYEQARTDRVLAREGLKRDPAPEGKRIAFVKLIRDEVFLEDEVWPTWPNIFHMTTREPVIERELLFARGQSFRDARAEETMRNLRNLGVFALVRIVAVRTPDPSAVGVVVHTREFWSLRFEHDFTYTTGLDALMLQLAERNLLGRNKTVTLRYS